MLKLPGEMFFRRIIQIVRCKISMGTKGGMRNKMILAAVSWMAAMLRAMVRIECCPFGAVSSHRGMVCR